jgi:hypothetical protein
VLVKPKGERGKAIAHMEAALKAIAARDEARRCAVAGRKPRPLTAGVALQIADIANVPDADLESFFFASFSFVSAALGVAKRHKSYQASDLKNSAKRIEAAARKLEAVLSAASEGALDHVRLCLPPPRAATLEEHIKLVHELTEAAKIATCDRPGQPWVQLRKLLIGQFLSGVARAGGRLTVSGDEGTLFDAFDCLRPCLPEKFRASRSTLRRLWRKGARGPKQVKSEQK